MRNAISSRNQSLQTINLPAVKSIKGYNRLSGATYQIDRIGHDYEVTIWAYSETLMRTVAIPAGTYQAHELIHVYPELNEVTQWIISR